MVAAKGGGWRSLLRCDSLDPETDPLLDRQAITFRVRTRSWARVESLQAARWKFKAPAGPGCRSWAIQGGVSSVVSPCRGFGQHRCNTCKPAGAPATGAQMASGVATGLAKLDALIMAISKEAGFFGKSSTKKIRLNGVGQSVGSVVASIQ
jgi:hypothetical protein